MTRRHRFAAFSVVLAGLGWWIWHSPGASGSQPDPHAAPDEASQRADTSAFGRQVQTARGRTGAIDWQPPSDDRGGMVSISGTVVDLGSHSGVGNVEVVFRTPDGEASVTTSSDGSYRIEVASGTYRAFVRDDHVLSIGREDLIRLPGMPPPDAAEVPDDAADADGGRDRRRRAPRSVGAARRGRRGPRRRSQRPPGRGRDGARARRQRRAAGARAPTSRESDSAGRFTLQLPPGGYHARGDAPAARGHRRPRSGSTCRAATRIQTQVTLTAGCVISGRVVRGDGQPADDGAIERRVGDGEHELRAGRPHRAPTARSAG